MMNRQSLLDEIRRLAAGRLSADELQKLIDEARAHLDASFQEHLSLGRSAAEAEQQAVNAFGSARDFVRPILRRKSRAINRAAFLIALVAVFSAATVGANFTGVPPFAVTMLSCIPLVACGAMGVLGKRLAKVPFMGLVFACLISTPTVAAIQASTNVIDSCGNTFTRSNLRDQINFANTNIPLVQKNGEHVLQLIRDGKAIAGKPLGPYHFHVLHRSGVVSVETFYSQRDALGAIRQEEGNYLITTENQLSSLEAARDDAKTRLATTFAQNFRGFIGTGAIYSLSTFLLLSLCSGFGACIAILSRRMRRPLTS
jgi:hypothetical protein